MLLAEDSLILPATPDLVWGTVSFLIIAVAVYKFAWPTFMRTLDERTAKIEEGLNAAALAKDEVAAERAQLALQVEDAQREAAQIREKAQANAASIIAQAQRTATDEAQRIADASQRQIEADANTARRSLRTEVGVMASELAGRIVGEQTLDPEVSQRVIDRFLDELEASSPVPASTEEN
ncbi:MAG: F0F1 ATP synthase subunit B [Actinomycetaceae bacterium]|jgi:F-type H+-transporting ATPase subunit b|nr:F0F1 ATP synthase subunit B [Actinomycetaceae bacterium]